ETREQVSSQHSSGQKEPGSTAAFMTSCRPGRTWHRRDLRSQMGSERGLVEEYVEKMPNPSLKAFKPVDLSDLKRRNTQDAKKS
uniref:Uncharacterized protein n=1 Tax=Meleagris gallopavo TaxID=9103 RepID=A0A803YG94_MELGA